MRIAVASTGLGHVARGIESWAADLSRALHDRGEDITLFKGAGRADADYEVVVPCWQRGSAATARLLHWLPRGAWRLGLGSAYEVEQTTFTLNLIRELRRRRVDVLHVQDPRVALLVQRARRLGLVRTTTILAHGTEEPFAFQSCIRYLQHLAPWHLEQARAAGAWRPEWTAIPNFVDTDLFHPGRADGLRRELGIPADHHVVLTAAAIKRHHKRVDYLLTEFARFLAARPDARATLVVAGGYEAQTDELVALGRELLGDRVRFLVRFPRARMPELYRAADTFVLCSLFEMMPMAVLEAMASGLPALVHRHPVLDWMSGRGERTLDMAAEGELVAELIRQCDAPAALAGRGEAARRHVCDQFGRDPVVDRIVEYYRFVLRHARSPHGRAAARGRPDPGTPLRMAVGASAN